MQGLGHSLPRQLALLAIIASCGGGTSAAPDAADAAAGADAAVDAPSGPRVRWSGVVYDLDRQKPITTDEQPPLAGVEVCSVVPGEASTCVTTASDGVWTLQFPAERKGVAFSTARAGHASLLNLGSTLDSDELDVILFLPRSTDVGTFMSSCGTSAPTATDVGVLVQGYQRIAPAYVPLDGGTMTASAGVGPCYMQSPWLHGANQTTTTTDGLGYGVFGTVPVSGDTVNVGVALTGVTCTPARGAAPVLTDGTIELPLEPGFFTHIQVICE